MKQGRARLINGEGIIATISWEEKRNRGQGRRHAGNPGPPSTREGNGVGEEIQDCKASKNKEPFLLNFLLKVMKNQPILDYPSR